MLLAESLLSSSSLEPIYIEDVFSTWLYSGNGSTQTIANGMDLVGKGGLVWIKARDFAYSNILTDTARGANIGLESDTDDPQYTGSGLTSFLANGFSLTASGTVVNTNQINHVSWTFCKQNKFFDVVTYTGNGANRTVAHNLGSVPGCIIVKRTDADSNWQVYHRSLANTEYMVLNSTAGATTGATRWNSTTPTSSVFSLGTDTTVNANGGTYVAYLFAHDAGGFGATNEDNVITCGSYTGNGSGTGPVVTLGYEPQWLLVKRVGTGDWNLIDNMRDFAVGRADAELNPNQGQLESTGTFVTPTARGFQLNTTNTGYNASGSVYIYVAVRRGPMRIPTSGTGVFSPITFTGAYNVFISGDFSRGGRIGTTGPALDLAFIKASSNTDNWAWTPRLIGYSSTGSIAPSLASNSTAAEVAQNGGVRGTIAASTDLAFKAVFSTSGTVNTIVYAFSRAPSFFDVMFYTGTNNAAPQTLNHNLGVQPELIIVKNRGFNTDDNSRWNVGSKYLSGSVGSLVLNTTAARSTAAFLDSTWDASANANTITISGNINLSGFDYVAYLFASCPGVSKIGTYTGTGATQVIDCGFTAGARFILVKRTDNAGSWHVWDSARGIVAGNDLYLLLNSTAGSVTNTDWVDTATSGFELSNAAGNNANINGASYIFLAIA